MNSHSLDPLNPSDSVVGRIHEVIEEVRQTNGRRRRLPNRQIAALSVLILIISFVSVYDVYWSFKTANMLPDMEENPIGSWLIRLDGGDISLFMTCKMVGTMLVILSIPALYSYKRWWGLTTAGSLATFQTLLFAYLNWGDKVW